jgi:hypothetical protein
MRATRALPVPSRSTVNTRRWAQAQEARANQFADFLLGLPENVQQGVPFNFNLVNSLFAGYVQDNMHVTHNLSLNLGMRYELTTPRGDKNAERQRELQPAYGNAGDWHKLQHLQGMG